jgi:hypothetical protein
LKKLLKNPLTWIITVFLLYVLIGFLILPVIIKNQMVSIINDQFKREAKIESVSFNPFTFELGVGDFSLLDKDHSVFLYWKNFTADLKVFPLINNRIEVENATITEPTITIKKLNESEYNFSDLTKLQKNPPDTSWKVLIKKFAVYNSSLKFIDNSLSPPAQIFIDSINFEAFNVRPLSSDTTKFRAALQIRGGGKLIASGVVNLQPSSSKIHYEISKLPLNIFNQYFSQSTQLVLSSGYLSTTGDINLSIKDTSKIPYVSYNGNFMVNDLKLSDSKTDQTMVEWKSRSSDKIFMVSSPFSVKINEVLLNEFYAPVILYPKIDFLKVLKSIPVATEEIKSNISKATNTSEDDIKFDIGKIKINNSSLTLTDLSLSQEFTVYINSLNGNITGLSKDSPLSTSLNTAGVVGQDGLVNIDGKINLFDPLGYAVLRVEFKNIDIPQFTPYSMKFLGYKVKNGKLSLRLQTEIKNQVLISQNKIYLNKLTLGEKVEETDTLDLPIETAIALLKDKDGNIDLDVEVKGDLNEPPMDVGALVWWAVKRSFTKAVEAPFNYLGELLGISGDELEYIEFTPGTFELLQEQKQKLEHLSKLMGQRPGIILRISGEANPVLDIKALRSRKLNFAFTKRMTSIPADSLIDPLSVDPNFSKNILEAMYLEIFGKDSLETIKSKFSESTDQNSLENYLKELVLILENNQPISKEEVYNLASQRADAINNYISTYKISSDRLVLLESKIDENENNDMIKCQLGIGTP